MEPARGAASAQSTRDGPDPRAVRSMFARIAPRYDLLNRVLSAGVDRRWRAALVRAAGELSGRRALDVCCGTGDLSRELAEGGARVVALDFTPEMLALARPHARVSYAHGDALALPLRDGSVDLCAIAFGLRNVADRARALRELRRVLTPGGTLYVLEFSSPRGALLGPLYRTYFTRVLPRVGALVSGDRDAYRYLPRTVLAWPTPAELQRELAAAGLEACGHRLLTRGIACLHWGRAPGASGRAEGADRG